MRTLRTIVIMTTAAALLAACTSDKPAKSTPSVTAPGTTPTTMAPTTTAPTTTAPAGSGSSADPSGDDSFVAVEAWYTVAKPDIDAIQSDTNAITAAAGKQDVDAVQQACARLKLHVQKYKTDPAAPDRQLDVDLTQTMTYFASAATACLAGDIPTLTTDLTKGTSYFQQANVRLSSLQ